MIVMECGRQHLIRQHLFTVYSYIDSFCLSMLEFNIPSIFVQQGSINHLNLTF